MTQDSKTSEEWYLICQTQPNCTVCQYWNKCPRNMTVQKKPVPKPKKTDTFRRNK